MAQRRFHGLFVVVAHRGDHGVSLSWRDFERRELGVPDGSSTKAGHVGDPHHRGRGRGVAEHEKQRFRQAWLDEDVERPATGAGGRDHQLASLSRLLHLVAADDVNELRRSLGQRPQGLSSHHRLRAAAADPAAQPSVGRDERLVTGPRGSGRLGTHDRRQRARRAVGRVLPEQVEDVAGYSVTPLDRSAAHTLSGPIGMSMLVMPYGDRASITALT